jgi:xanthine dehydrogenase accessory factor
MIQPTQQIFTKIEEAFLERKPVVFCLIVGTQGSTPRKTGAKMLVYSDGSVAGSIGGGAIEKEVIGKALELMRSRKPVKICFNLGDDLEMHCGGSMEVYLEPLNPQPNLYIFGAGHIGRALAGFARELDFTVTLFDPREEIRGQDWTSGFRLVGKDYLLAVEEAVFDENTFAVIVTPKHLLDEEIVAAVARRPHAYLGMIGSDRKVALLKKRFLAENILTREELDGIDMPVGIKFNAETPREIAISILAKLIDVRNTVLSEKI